MSDFTFPNPTPVYPSIPGLVFPINKRPTFASLVFTAVSGRETRSAQQAYPLWEFELTYDFLKDQTQNSTPFMQNAGRQDLQQISELFYACNGQYGQFYFEDASDNSRTGQVIGTGDGSTTQFVAVRNWGNGALAVPEPVGGINTLLDVYFNGTPVSSADYSFSGNVITFASAPANGVTISIDFTFYYLCRFIEDMHDYSEFMKNLWELKSCKFRSVKP